MKAKNLSDYIIAAVVIGCSLIMLAAMTMALTGFENNTGGRKVIIDMPSVTGLRMHSQVRYAGAPIGKIVDIRTLNWDERSSAKAVIRVTAKLEENAPALKTDSVASISSDTLLAEKFLDLEPGSLESPVLPEDQPLSCKEVASFDDLQRAGLNALTSINDVLAEIQKDGKGLPSKVNNLLVKADTLADNADSLVQEIDQILKKNDQNLDQTLTDLKVVTQNLKIVSTYAKSITGTLGRKPWRLVWGTTPNELPTEEEILESSEPVPLSIPKKEKRPAHTSWPSLTKLTVIKG
jgi:ABC-type transporter Mla subunit MlaD